jgi:cytochrome P450
MLSTPEGLDDPYAVHRQLRQRATDGESIGNIVVDWSTAADVLSHPELSSDRVDAICSPLDEGTRVEVATVHETLAAIIAFQDPPDHTRIRKLLRQAFTPRVLRHQQEVVDQTVGQFFEQLADTADGSPVDVHQLVSYPFPAKVISGMLGIPEEVHARFQKWALDIVLFVGSGRLDRAIALSTLDSINELRRFMPDLVAARRADPGSDLLSALIEASDDDGHLSENELFANALFLMTAGHETATNGISNGLVALLRHPDQFRALVDDPTLIDSAVEEVLRFESPVQMTPRLATDDLEIHGHNLRAGDALVVLLGAASRDGEQFEDPDRFDITRADNRHLAFGHGAHWCLGGNLARQEMRSVIGRFARDYPEASLASEPQWQPTLNFRGPTSLMVELNR